MKEVWSEAVPSALVALHLYVPLSALEVPRTTNVMLLDEVDSVYLEVDWVIMVWELDADIKVQEDEVTAGFAETEHGIVASCPVTTV